MRSIRLAAVHGDGWAPVVDDVETFERGLAIWRRRRDDAGLPPGDVTVFEYDVDEARLAGYADLGATRIVVHVPVDDAAALQRRLDDLVALAPA